MQWCFITRFIASDNSFLHFTTYIVPIDVLFLIVIDALHELHYSLTLIQIVSDNKSKAANYILHSNMDTRTFNNLYKYFIAVSQYQNY